jgi:hypothetical protein
VLMTGVGLWNVEWVTTPFLSVVLGGVWHETVFLRVACSGHNGVVR